MTTSQTAPPSAPPDASPSTSRLPRLVGTILLAVVMTVALGLLLLVLAGVFQPKVPTTPPMDEGTSAKGLLQAPVRLIHKPRYESAVGTVRAVHEASVASRILARVLELKIKAGQVVAQDEVLARLDDTDLQARVKQAEASVGAAQASLTKAMSERERASRLMASRAISQEEFDRAVAAFRTATADLARAQQGVKESKSLLDFATIRSPITGIIIDKRVEAGDTVNPGQTLMTIYDPKRMQMLATVRESLALQLKVGQKIPGRLEALEHACEATVSEIVPEVQAGSRSFTVKVTGPCPPGVYSGMFGRIFIPLGEEDIVVVPEKAVYRVGQLDMVDVVVEDHAQRRVVQLGRKLSEGYEVLSGLKPAEMVVIRTTEAKP